MRLVLLLPLLLTACSEPAPPTVPVRAVYLEPLFDGQAARFDHEAVPGWMDAMTMPLRVADPALLEGVAPGADVVLEVDTSTSVVMGLTPAPQAPTNRGGE